MSRNYSTWFATIILGIVEVEIHKQQYCLMLVESVVDNNSGGGLASGGRVVLLLLLHFAINNIAPAHQHFSLSLSGLSFFSVCFTFVMRV